MLLTIKLLYTMRYATPMYAFKGFVGYNGKAVLLAVNLGVTDFCGATVRISRPLLGCYMSTYGRYLLTATWKRADLRGIYSGSIA